ncbi:WbqC family protein [bacterium]|nr:WbqC family protein [bacterium]
MKRVVILQPQFFPWRGVFEQIRLADIYVHFDDVAFPQGRSFLTRVQVKTRQGPAWLTVPVRRDGERIRDVQTDDSQPWRTRHLKTLQQVYASAPYVDDMLDIVRAVYAAPETSLSAINSLAIEKVSRYLGLKCTFKRSSDLGGSGKGQDRLLEIANHLGANVYLTGHGALNYLLPTPFENAGVGVEVMDYRRGRYPQIHGEFDPHVSILDLIANTGQKASTHLESQSLEWGEYERTREVST